MRYFYLGLSLVLLVVLGCLASKKAAPRVMRKESGAPQEEVPAGARAPAGKPAAPEPRKIIYTARVELVVDGFEKAEQALEQLVQQQGGYLAKSDVQGSPGSPRTGNWTVRVPVEHFQSFMAAVAGLGELRHSSMDSDDITDQYFDLEARIKNKQREEERLLDLLKKATGNLKDVLAVEENLSRVRGEIEQEQGQRQRWDKETKYATVNVVIYDRKDYVPPTAPAFGTSIGRAFWGSIGLLVDFARGTVLVVVALAPWLAILAVFVVPAWLAIRRRRRNLIPRNE